MRLLHARDPDGGDRPPRRAARRRRARRSSSCSPGTSAAAPATSRSSRRSLRRRRRGAVNLALSLLYAAERTPERRGASSTATSGSPTPSSASAPRRLAGGLAELGVEPGDRVAAVARQPPRDRAALLGLPVARRRLRAALAPASRRRTSTTASTDSGARRRPSRRRGARAAARATPSIPGALDLDEREPAIMLYTSGTTGPAEGRAALAPRRARRRPRRRSSSTATATATARSASCRSTTRWASTRCSRCRLIGGCFVCQPDWDAGRGARLIEAERITSLYLAPTLFHDLVHAPAPAPSATSRRVEASATRARR